MGVCCWRRHQYENDEVNQQQILNQKIKRRRELQKPVILFYNFQGPFSCQIKTKHPYSFICFPKTERTNCIKWEGEIKNNKICIGKHNYPYLFWESQNFSITNIKPHFRFSGESMAEEIFQLLLKLGLSQEQSTNFVTFWIHKWQQQQSWLVHVLSQQTINQLYPLCILPQPSQIKRFYLLFGKDFHNIILERLQIRSWKMSNEKTVIQWGAVEYDFSFSKQSQLFD